MISTIYGPSSCANLSRTRPWAPSLWIICDSTWDKIFFTLPQLWWQIRRPRTRRSSNNWHCQILSWWQYPLSYQKERTNPSDLCPIHSARTTLVDASTLESMLVTNNLALGAGSDDSFRTGRPRWALSFECERELRRGEEDELEDEPDLFAGGFSLSLGGLLLLEDISDIVKYVQ